MTGFMGIYPGSAVVCRTAASVYHNVTFVTDAKKHAHAHGNRLRMRNDFRTLDAMGRWANV
jgi:hypothetical protein